MVTARLTQPWVALRRHAATPGDTALLTGRYASSARKTMPLYW